MFIVMPKSSSPKDAAASCLGKKIFDSVHDHNAQKEM